MIEWAIFPQISNKCSITPDTHLLLNTNFVCYSNLNSCYFCVVFLDLVSISIISLKTITGNIQNNYPYCSDLFFFKVTIHTQEKYNHDQHQNKNQCKEILSINKSKKCFEPSSEFSVILRGLPRFRFVSGVAGVIVDEPDCFCDVPDAVVGWVGGIYGLCFFVLLYVGDWCKEQCGNARNI